MVVTAPATAVGFGNSSTMNGIYSSFPPGDLVYWYLWETCDNFYTSPIQTANATFPSAGTGSVPGYQLNGLSAETLYCFESCVVSPSTKPDLAVCGGVQTFQWTIAVR